VEGRGAQRSGQLGADAPSKPGNVKDRNVKEQPMEYPTSGPRANGGSSDLQRAANEGPGRVEAVPASRASILSRTAPLSRYLAVCLALAVAGCGSSSAKSDPSSSGGSQGSSSGGVTGSGSGGASDSGSGGGQGSGGVTATGGLSGTSGSGGASAGTGGGSGTATGGSAATGGTTGSPGTGGKVAGSGGATSSGGVTSSGGTTSSGGATASGGATGSGGAVAASTLVTSAQNAYWKTGTWTDSTSTATVTVNDANSYQTWEGFGGAFNEKGWSYLTTQAMQDQAIQLLFAKDGCNFAWGRIPIGASDYAMDRYSLNETANDTSMSMFSIDRDKMKLIPYIKARWR